MRRRSTIILSGVEQELSVRHYRQIPGRVAKITIKALVATVFQGSDVVSTCCYFRKSIANSGKGLY